MASTISDFQWGGLIFGMLYIVFADRQFQHCWIYGFVSAVCIVVEDYTHTRLYADGFLHVMYAMMAILGVFLWRKGKAKEHYIRLSKIGTGTYLGYLLISLLIGGAAGYLLDHETDALFPYLDAFSSTLAVFATFLVIYRVIDVWSFWILINVISIYLYWQTGAPLLGLLYVGYLISNILKWKSWHLQYKLQQLG